VSTTHTPGPWSAFTDDSGATPHTNIVAVNPFTDCVFSLPGHTKDEPNIALVCAAPDMLAALQRADTRLYVARNNGFEVPQGDIDAIRNAIAKATAV